MVDIKCLASSALHGADQLSFFYWTRQEVFEQTVEHRLRAKLEALHSLPYEHPRDPEFYLEIARLHDCLQEQKLSLVALEKGLSACGQDLRLLRRAILTLEECNQPRQAIEIARKSAVHFPHEALFALKSALSLPILYDTMEEIGEWREHYQRGLDLLSKEISLETPGDRKIWLDAIGCQINFYLAYQARNDCSLQEQYGSLVHRIMQANYPHWAEPLPMPSRSEEGRIRVGYVSTNFHRHSTSLISVGWLRECNRRNIELHAYYTRSAVDHLTEEVRRACDHFHHIPNNLEAVCQAIREDQLHVLVFIEVGMDPMMTQLAGLRLAPVQCATLAHPSTTGLPTVDYFLSSDLMEPPDAQDHYTERLVRLPGIGSCRQKLVVPHPLTNQSRTWFGLREDAIVYLCCQTSFKYLPQHDWIIVEIAKRVPSAQFVFLRFNEVVDDHLQARFRRAFTAAGLDADFHCMWLPRLTYVNYWNLNLVADVFLDSLGFSGFATTTEAIACGLPVVTLPGKFSRGRQSYAALKQLGVTETIACSEADYVDIAVRLGCDREWRAQVIQHMADGHQSLFWDTRSVQALEEFYLRAVEDGLART